MKRYRVVKPYKTPFDSPFRAEKGEKVRFERRRTTFEGWIWCIRDSGDSAWVPESWVELEEETCVFTRDYDSTELSVALDEVVQGDLTASGWIWATDHSGKTGWVPLKCLKLIEK
jgi:hypothetical protein